MNYALLFAVAFVLNLPFGYFRNRYEKMTVMWFVMIHAPIPAIVLLRNALGISFSIPLFLCSITLCILGQTVGSRMLPKWLKQPAEQSVEV